MLRYFLATNDQVLRALSERMPFFHTSLIELKKWYTRKLGNFRSSGNTIKTMMYLSTPSYADTSVFIGHRYVIYIFVGTKGRFKKKNECELIPNAIF